MLYSCKTVTIGRTFEFIGQPKETFSRTIKQSGRIHFQNLLPGVDFEIMLIKLNVPDEDKAY